MNAVSSNYKNLLNTSLSLTPRYKIVIDNVEYLSNVIKSYPKISHSNTKFVGGFPTKTLDMEIYDLEGNLNLEDKEIIVYKGFVVNGSIEYAKQGVFIAKSDKITTNISSKTISLSNVQDRTQLLDDKYESSLDWSTNHTGLEIIQEICTKKGITLSSNAFNFANYSFKQPNFSESTTYREVISRLAEIGGEIALFNCNGELVIKGQYTTGDTIKNQRYEKLSRENAFVVNTVVLGKEGMDDDIVYPESIATERVEFKILDNPFVDLYREEMIEEVSKYIIGLSYIPYKAENMIDGFIYELNDIVSIVDKNGETFNAVILDISNNSRIKSNVKAEVNGDSKTNYNLAGSKKQTINQVKLQVDHINSQITAMAQQVNEATGIVNSVELALNSQQARIDVLSTNIDTTTGEVTSVKTGKGYTFGDDGLNISDPNESFNTQITNRATQYKDGDEVITETSKDGFMTTNLKEKGTHQYSYDKDGDTYDMVAERIEVDGEYAYAHFYNGGDL